MSKILRQIRNYISNPNIRFMYNNKLGLYRGREDRFFYEKYYKIALKKDLNLEKPETYNEKIQWLKLYDRNPLYTKLVDKYEVKEYISEKIGDEYIVPTLGIYDYFDEIDFSELPEKFVIKVTHDSGGVIICKDKSKLNIDSARKTINKALKRDYYLDWHEWPYKDVPKRIIIEELLEDSECEDLRDYKFFAFDGDVKALFVASDRQSDTEETKFDFYDEDFNFLPFINGHPNSDRRIEKPKTFDKMKEIASVLSKGIPHVRVDLYEVNGKIYFGEMTFAHWSGFVPFEPEEWDYTFGSWIKLPINKND